MSNISNEDKELIKNVKQLLKISEITEKELQNEINSKAEEVADTLVARLIHLIQENYKEIRLKIVPNISLNYSDSVVILRIIPSEAANLINNSYQTNKLFPSFSLSELFNVKPHELYSFEYRKKLCNIVGKLVLAKLKEVGFNAKMTDESDYYKTQNVEYKVTIHG